MIKITKKIKYFNYKIKFLLFILAVLLLLILAIFLLRKTYSKYVSDVNIDISMATAMYVFEEGKLNFNMDLNGIVPSDSPYIYSFTIANYNEQKRSDVDIEYTLKLLTTTNMPLTYQLYRNQNYNDQAAVNIITNYSVESDEDGAWYNELTIDDTYTMNYRTNTTDLYYLVIYFPAAYKSNLTYADAIDNVEVIIDSHQMIE